MTMFKIPDNVSKYDNVYDVLQERGFIEQVTDPEAARDLLGREKIKFYIGDAVKLIPEMDLYFDMAFIDGNKRKYIEYYDLILPRLTPGGYIIADNTLWDGHVLEATNPADQQTAGIKAFNDMIANDERIEKVILPLRDGLTIIRKKTS